MNGQAIARTSRQPVVAALLYAAGDDGGDVNFRSARMSDSPVERTGLVPRSGGDIKAVIEMERRGRPFVVWREPITGQRIVSLGEQRHMTVGRGGSCDIALTSDVSASRVHAELERIGEEWTISDDGLSANGTFVNGARVRGRKRLADGDLLRFGATVLAYHAPGSEPSVATHIASKGPSVEDLTKAQRRVLEALCRPYTVRGGAAVPASNKQIADELSVGVEAVKGTLRTLFQEFEIGPLPQYQKRVKLAEDALRWGLVAEKQS